MPLWFRSQWRLQLICYFLGYFLQGLLFGSLGPSLSYLSAMSSTSVISLVPVYSANGLGALFMAMFGDLILASASHRAGRIIVLASVFLTIALVVTPFVAVYGPIAICGLFFVKGSCAALLNITIHRCCGWIAAEKVMSIEYLVNYLNGSFGLGTVLGPIFTWSVLQLSHQITWVFWIFGILFNTVTVLGVALESPFPPFLPSRSGSDQQNLSADGTPTQKDKKAKHKRPSKNRRMPDESVSLLGYGTENSFKIPALPSPLIGGVFFVRMQHDLGAKQLSRDTYNRESSFIVLMGTIMCMLFSGIQIGLSALLCIYLQWEIDDINATSGRANPTTVSYTDPLYLPTIGILSGFWGAMVGGFFLFQFLQKFWNRMTPLLLLWVECIGCVVSAILLIQHSSSLQRPDTDSATSTIVRTGLIGGSFYFFGVFFCSIFHQTIEVVSSSIEKPLVQRVSSLIIFGVGCGEIFIPLLMCFVTGSHQGSAVGAVAIVYIVICISVAMIISLATVHYSIYQKVETEKREANNRLKQQLEYQQKKNMDAQRRYQHQLNLDSY